MTVTITTYNETEQLSTIKIAENGSATIAASDNTNYSLWDSSIKRAPTYIKATRDGNNLILELSNVLENYADDSYIDFETHSTLTITGFYNFENQALTGLNEVGDLYYFIPTETVTQKDGDITANWITNLEDGDVTAQELGAKGPATNNFEALTEDEIEDIVLLEARILLNKDIEVPQPDVIARDDGTVYIVPDLMANEELAQVVITYTPEGETEQVTFVVTRDPDTGEWSTDNTDVILDTRYCNNP